MDDSDRKCKIFQKDSSYERKTIKDMIWKKLETIKFEHDTNYVARSWLASGVYYT